jgi:hypothetical protein
MAALRHAPLLVLMILQLQLQVVAAQPDTPLGDRCSKALGFNETEGPKDRSSQDLPAFCVEHHQRTCCGKNHTRDVLGRFAAFSYNISGRCGKMTRLSLCSFCDGDVGAGLKSRLNQIVLCSGFCERWFNSCREDFFAPGSSGSGLSPCGPASLVCSPLDEIVEDSRPFCEAVSPYSVATSEEELDGCYDGVPAARSRGKGPRAPYVRPSWRGRTPFWRQMWPPSHPSQWPTSKEVAADLAAIQLPPWAQAYAPGVAIASVVLLFTWYLWRSSD